MNNVLPISVTSGPAGNYVNGAFASVTVCVPGTTTCQTIDGLLVDTGSSGLRVLSSVLSIPLPGQADSSGRAIAECAQFQDGFTWGPVETATIKMAGEQATAVPMQVIGPAGFVAPPTGCTSTGGPPENTLDTLGANGILGIGMFRQDCGIGCAIGGNSNPGLYYSCTPAGCVTAIEALTSQVQNPVWLFPQDNNGVLITLPSVPPNGALGVAGSLIFGIGTQSNNGLGSAKAMTPSANGTVTTVFNAKSYGGSFIDSGSNGLYFLDTATTGLPACRFSIGFYCPTVLQTLSATLAGANGSSATIPFSVANADQLQAVFTAFSTLAGNNPGSFDWGLPFFYGRPVFTAIEGQTTPAGAGPYWAF